MSLCYVLLISIKCLLEIISYLLIISQTTNLSLKKISVKIMTVQIMCVLVLGYICMNYADYDLFLTLSLVITIIFTITYFDEKFKIIFLAIIYSLVFYAFIQQCLSLFFTDSIYNYYNSHYIYYNLLCFFVTWIIICLHKKIGIPKLNLHKSFVILFVIIVLSIIYCFLPLVFIEIINQNVFYSIGVVFFCYSGLIIFFILGYKYTKFQYHQEILLRENKSKEKIINMQAVYFDSIMNNFQEIREFRHDMLAHLNVILELAKEKRDDELIEYVISCLKINDDRYLYKCSNSYINAIINSQRSLLIKNEIDFELIYEINGTINIDTFDLSSLFYNLLVNSIEAVEKIENERFIRCKFSTVDNNLYIMVCNSIDFSFNIENVENHVSSKDDKQNHGLGIMNIKSIVNKYNGLYKISENKDVFITDIIFFNIVSIENEK